MAERTLEDLARAGYVTEEWGRWQQGCCGTYAIALTRMRSGLRFGTLGVTGNGSGDASGGWMPAHHFAHDDAYAYDSAGRHPLPYYGVHGDMDYSELDGDPADEGLPDSEGTTETAIRDAQDHARRNGILSHLPEQET
jgi:hypothetical protein